MICRVNVIPPPIFVFSRTLSDKMNNFHNNMSLEQQEYEHFRQELKRKQAVLNSISEALSQFITDVDPRILFDKLLTDILAILHSEYGFIGEVFHTLKGEPFLKTHAITNIAWDEETRTFYETNKLTGLEFYNLKSLFGEVLVTGQAVIANHPATDPRRIGIPFGHPPLNAFLGLPFYKEQRLIGMVGVANRPGGYDEHIVQEMQPILLTCANIISAYQQRKQSAKELHDSHSLNAELERRVTLRTEELLQANQEISRLNVQLTAENSRMSTELEVARRLQEMVLPNREELDKITFLDIATFVEPAAEVGGDYYDILQEGPRVKIAIGDVTGHGLESGVLMLMVQTAVRTLLTNGTSNPQTFLTSLNQVVYGNLRRFDMDKNLTFCLLDYLRGELRISGQHEDILVLRNNHEIQRIDTLNLGFMIGLRPDISAFLGQETCYLEVGEGIVLYTDGITEAQDEQEEVYGVERLVEVIRQHHSQNAIILQQAIIEDVKRHIGQQKVLDDITLLVVKRLE